MKLSEQLCYYESAKFRETIIILLILGNARCSKSTAFQKPIEILVVSYRVTNSQDKTKLVQKNPRCSCV